MKTSSIISKFSKVGITFSTTPILTSVAYVAESKNMMIGFTSRDGKASSVATWAKGADLQSHSFTGKDYHKSIRDVVQWVLRQDSRAA